MDSSDARTTDARTGDRPASTRFAEETSVRRIGPGRYRGHMHRSWWIISGPNGGYVAAVVLRAIVAEVADPQRRPRSFTLQYLRPPAEGPVDVSVTIERSGRSVTNVSARMSQDGRDLVLALAALATDRPSELAFDEEGGLPRLPGGAPVPLPERVPSVEVDVDRDVPMRSHYDLKWVLGDRLFQPDGPPAEERTARCGGWLRPAEAEPIDEVALAAMTDAWLPPIFGRVDEPLAVPTVDLTMHFRGLPEDPLDHCFVEFASPLARDGYLVEHGRILSRSGRLLVESRQLAVLV